MTAYWGSPEAPHSICTHLGYPEHQGVCWSYNKSGGTCAPGLIKSSQPLQDPTDRCEQHLLLWAVVPPTPKENPEGLCLCLRLGVWGITTCPSFSQSTRPPSASPVWQTLNLHQFPFPPVGQAEGLKTDNTVVPGQTKQGMDALLKDMAMGLGEPTELKTYSMQAACFALCFSCNPLNNPSFHISLV